MAEFFYEALDKGGRQVRGVIEAGNEELIIERLRGMGYYPLRVGAHKTAAQDIDLFALPGIRNLAHRVRPRHLVVFTRQLATLIESGIPVIRSLMILTEQIESVVFRDTIGVMIKDVENGVSLSEAMSKHPKIFDALYVNMVRAGEVGGVLESVLDCLAYFLEKRQALKGKVKSALMYPLIVCVLASLIVGFILWKIMPRFAAIFEQLGAELPALTQGLIDASNILVHKTPYVVAAIVFFWIAIRQIYSTRSGKYLFDRVSLKLPLLGSVMCKVAIARFATTLSTLVAAGVPILQALDIVRDTSGNEVVSRAMDKVYDSVRDGNSIHEPLAQCAVFPPLVVHMVAVGEETGAIDKMLAKVAEAYEREVDDTVNALASILEPVLLVLLGCIIGVIVVALYLPMFVGCRLIQ